MNNRPIIVIGAGICGLTLTLALLRQKINVLLFDKEKEIEQRGAGINISPNGTSILYNLGLKEEINKLKPFTASMGMMLENTSRRLTKKGMPHYACPDKIPIQRIRTMENMGELKVPFTTGILIGIGENWEERIETLQEIQNSHLKYGHIQEVIIQNFVPKPNIKMKYHPKPKHDEILKTIALARIILSPEISIQAPPNLSLEHPEYLNVGLNDWGGISPITKDFINPEKKWPLIKDLNNASKLMGYFLNERLTV